MDPTLQQPDINQEAQNNQRAILNILEDLSLEREKLKDTNAKDEAILASIGDGLVVADGTGKLIYFNQQAEDIMGKGLVSTDPSTWQQEYGLFDPITLQPLPLEQNPLFIAVHGRPVDKVELFVRNPAMPQGKFISVTARPILSDGKSIGGVVIFHDITKETAVDKAKTEFVSLASHQLRTPLSAIGWYTEMVLSGDTGDLNQEQKQYLGEVYKGSRRMGELINALLNVSRLELGTFIVEPEPTDIVKLAQTLTSEQRPQIEAKKIIFEQNYAVNLPIFNADPKLLGMIFQNLLSNAIKYTPAGGRVNPATGQADQLSIVVADTGYGIPKDQQGQIFAKLFRADNVRKLDTEGTGLGLYIVKSIVDHSDGKIWFESAENQGTTFHVTFPLKGMKKKEGEKALA